MSDILKESLGEKGSGFLGPYDVQIRLTEMKRNIARYKERPPSVPDWLREFATLPPKEVGLVLTVMLDLRSRLQSELHHLLRPHLVIDARKIRQYVDAPTEENLASMLTPEFRDRAVSGEKLAFARKIFAEMAGGNLESMIRADLKSEKLGLGRPQLQIGDRKTLEDAVLSAWALCALMFLAAFTFAHAEWTRYPHGPRSGAKELNCDSYTERLGIVSCLRDLGRLCGDVVYDIATMLDTASRAFSVFSSAKTADYPVDLRLLMRPADEP